MRAPAQIKRALQCLSGLGRDELRCSICPYRRESNCLAAAAQDAAAYISALEKAAQGRMNSRGGRIRTVYLYTITGCDGETICTDATRDEAAAALGYATHQGLTYAWKRQQAGKQLPFCIERKKGMIGAIKGTCPRLPTWVYTVYIAGEAVRRCVSLNEMAEYFDLTPAGMRSALTQNGIACSDRIAYRNAVIERKRLKEENKE